MAQEFSFTIEDVKFDISLSYHAKGRMFQRGVGHFAVYGCIVAMGERLLDMKNKEEFCIQDRDLNVSIVCVLHMDGMDVAIDVVTVLDNHMFFAKEQTRVYPMEGGLVNDTQENVPCA